MKQQLIDSGVYSAEEIMHIQACEDTPQALWQCVKDILANR